MTTALAPKPVHYLKKDADGHLYSVPEGEVFVFDMAVEEIQNAEWMSDEHTQLCYDFDMNFMQYRKDER